jgi:uridine phosphorylase
LWRRLAHRPDRAHRLVSLFGACVTGEVSESPLLRGKDPASPSVFRAEALLREARRQKGIANLDIPAICLLDPDGDIVRRLRKTGEGRLHPGWACYHSELLSFSLEDIGEVGVVGCAVGAPYAVLVAEQLFASGCRLLISITSSGQIAAPRPTPYFVLIERALRDEGTSLHYLPASRFAEAPRPELVARIGAALQATAGIEIVAGATWTTDAPFRETEHAISIAREAGAIAVEMEAAALYAYGQACSRDIVCFALVTNAMGQIEGDFEKGEADGVTASLRVVVATARVWLRHAPADESGVGGEAQIQAGC